jgi:hypothetical protein
LAPDSDIFLEAAMIDVPMPDSADVFLGGSVAVSFGFGGGAAVLVLGGGGAAVAAARFFAAAAIVSASEGLALDFGGGGAAKARTFPS